ncbi:MAG: hypothetical protein HY289_02680 [Planctomycetes bacterium]|nr:hypothetical protein [Planctomycetota bacterium]
MPRHPNSRTGSTGRLSYQPAPDEGPIPRTLEFLYSRLPAWRDDPKRPTSSSEKLLNSSLCDFLDSRARSDCPMVRFKHEAPQTESRTVDIGVHGTEDITSIGVHNYTIYQPFMAIECKRLPAPSPPAREREYVTGKHQTSGGPAGGIQRFKLGLHGGNVETAAIVGYIEENSPHYWHGAINGWITELANETSTDGCPWSQADMLGQLVCSDEQGTSTALSMHGRSNACVTPSIRIHHLWVVMSSAAH